MTWNDLAIYFENLSSKIGERLPDIVAETATEYYKNTFTKKAFDGNPWLPAKTTKKTGSLLIESGSLLNSIQPTLITSERVIISAGNEKVDYARVHNEGYNGPAVIPAHTRRTKGGKIANVREHTRQMNIPQRQFMDESRELAEKIVRRIENEINSLL